MAAVTLEGNFRTADYLSVEEAAQRLNVDDKTVRGYLYSEKFTTYKWKTLTLLSLGEVEKEIKRRKAGSEEVFY